MENQRWIALFLFLTSLIPAGMGQSGFEIHGHRGCRGLMPENSLSAFLKAVELGVTTLDMDVVVSMDGQLVLSHEPWMSHETCAHPDGTPVTKREAGSLNIYQMKYEAIQSFDCGKRFQPDFPRKQKLTSVKPTLRMTVRSVRDFATGNHYSEPSFSLELISRPAYYDVYIPQPHVFVDLVVNEIRRLGIEDRTTLQSFDVNILEELNKVTDRKFRIGYLVSRGKKLEQNIGKLTFIPDVYCPKFELVNRQLIEQAHEKGMKVIPWTINKPEQKDLLVQWGADGIATDYPDIIRN